MKKTIALLFVITSTLAMANATVFNSDGSSSSIYTEDNGDAMIFNSDGTSSTVYSEDNGDAMIFNSDGSSSTIYMDN